MTINNAEYYKNRTNSWRQSRDNKYWKRNVKWLFISIRIRGGRSYSTIMLHWCIHAYIYHMCKEHVCDLSKHFSREWRFMIRGNKLFTFELLRFLSNIYFNDGLMSMARTCTRNQMSTCHIQLCSTPPPSPSHNLYVTPPRWQSAD